MTEIHAHNVLNLLREKPMSEADLRQAVNQEFGKHAMFRTCKLNGFDLDALLMFFIQKQKIVQHEGKWSVNMDRVCGH